MGEKRALYRSLEGEPGGKKPLGRPRCRWVDNIKKDLVERGWGSVDWIGLAQDRYKWIALVNVVMKCWETIKWLHNWWPLKKRLSPQS
jgi:hypothetical protein